MKSVGLEKVLFTSLPGHMFASSAKLIVPSRTGNSNFYAFAIIWLHALLEALSFYVNCSSVCLVMHSVCSFHHV